MGRSRRPAIPCGDNAQQLPQQVTPNVTAECRRHRTQQREQVCPGVPRWCEQSHVLGGEFTPADTSLLSKIFMRIIRPFSRALTGLK